MHALTVERNQLEEEVRACVRVCVNSTQLLHMQIGFIHGPNRQMVPMHTSLLCVQLHHHKHATDSAGGRGGHGRANVTDE